MNVAVPGIPKTIDNDVNFIDHSFGFSSAVEAAQIAIRSAKLEATCNLPNGIGIITLMGRSAGSSQNNFVCERRLRRWAELFNERPSNGQGKAISNWLMRVMAVSNLSAPLPFFLLNLHGKQKRWLWTRLEFHRHLLPSSSSSIILK